MPFLYSVFIMRYCHNCQLGVSVRRPTTWGWWSSAWAQWSESLWRPRTLLTCPSWWRVWSAWPSPTPWCSASSRSPGSTSSPGRGSCTWRSAWKTWRRTTPAFHWRWAGLNRGTEVFQSDVQVNVILNQKWIQHVFIYMEPVTWGEKQVKLLHSTDIRYFRFPNKFKHTTSNSKTSNIVIAKLCKLEWH